MAIIGDALVVLGALALLIERVVDRFLILIWPDVDAGNDPSGIYKRIRGLLGVSLVLAGGIIFAFALDLNLMKQIFPDLEITATTGKWLTACMIGGGAAPAHEFVRYIENKKAKAKEEKAQNEADTKNKIRKG